MWVLTDWRFSEQVVMAIILVAEGSYGTEG